MSLILGDVETLYARVSPRFLTPHQPLRTFDIILSLTPPTSLLPYSLLPLQHYYRGSIAQLADILVIKFSN